MTVAAGASSVSCMNALRPRLVLVDRVLAIGLTAWLYAETWTTGSAQGHRVAVSLLWPWVTAAVALRRRFPTSVGVLAATIAIVAQAVWPSQVTGTAIGWMCDLYAITVWTSTRRFGGFVFFYLAASAASIALNPSGVRGLVFFTVVSTIVMSLVRIVVRRRLWPGSRGASLSSRSPVFVSS